MARVHIYKDVAQRTDSYIVLALKLLSKLFSVCKRTACCYLLQERPDLWVVRGQSCVVI